MGEINPVMHNRINLVGKLNVLETARLIQECDFGIYNDGMVAHIADALGKPGIVLFGSTLVSKNGPLNNTLSVIQSPLPCSPCQAPMEGGFFHKDSAFVTCVDYQCMSAITPEMVMEEAKKLLTGLP